MVLGSELRGGSGSGGISRRIGVLTLLLCLLGACGSSDGETSRRVVASDWDGYRVLAEESQVQGQAAIGVALNEVDYQALWERAGFFEDRPAVDFRVQAVVIVTTSYGSGCEPVFARLRIEGAEIELQSAGIEPGQTCAADENTHGVGLAITRSILTEGPYTVRAGGDVAELTLE